MGLEGKERRERRGCDQRGNGGSQCGGLVDLWRELDFDSEGDGKLLEVFKQRKDVILHRTRKDASQISPRVEAGRQERRMCSHPNERPR